MHNSHISLDVGAFPALCVKKFYTIVIGGLAIAMAGQTKGLATSRKDVGCARLLKK